LNYKSADERGKSLMNTPSQIKITDKTKLHRLSLPAQILGFHRLLLTIVIPTAAHARANYYRLTERVHTPYMTDDEARFLRQYSNIRMKFFDENFQIECFMCDFVHSFSACT